MVDEVEEIDWRVTHFWWPVREEQIFTSEIDGRNYVELNFGAARWVPTTLTSAKKWALRHPNAAGLREGADRLVIVKCKLSPTWDEFVQRRIDEGKEVPEKEEGSYDPPYIEDQTPILGEAEETKDAKKRTTKRGTEFCQPVLANCVSERTISMISTLQGKRIE